MMAITKNLKIIIGAIMVELIEYADGCGQFTPADAQSLLEDLELLKEDALASDASGEVLVDDTGKAVWLTCYMKPTPLGRECIDLSVANDLRWLRAMASMRRDAGCPAPGDDKLLGRSL